MKPTVRLTGCLLRRSDLRVDPALRTLLVLRWRGLRRRMLRGLKTPRGAIFTLLGASIFVLWIVPNLMMASSAQGHVDPASVRAIIPLGLLALCLLSILQFGGKTGVHFTGAEIDFLFSGPFTRRELLVYKLLPGVAGALVTALLFSFVFRIYVTRWVAAFVGFWLTMIFMQLFSTAAVLIAQTVAERAYTRFRRALLLVGFGSVGLGLWWGFSNIDQGGLLPVVRQFHDSWAGMLLLAPFNVFGRAITAQTLAPELVCWGSIALVMDLALLVLVLRLDVNYMESSVAVNRKIYRRLQQMRRSGGIVWAGKTTTRVRLPRLPWLGGAGPIARRQLISAVRSAPGVVVFLLLMIGPMALGMLVTHGVGNEGNDGHKVLGTLVPFVLVFVTVMFSRMLPFDFRGDLDQMDWLKSLPLRPIALAAGQIAVPTLALTLFHWLVLGGAAVFLAGSLSFLAVAAFYAIPFNFLVFALENLVFLLFPARMTPATPGDLQHVGRAMVEMMVKMLVLALGCGVAAGLGGIAYLLCGSSWIAAVAVSWSVLVLQCAILVPCVAAAYRKFDVSVDTPP